MPGPCRSFRTTHNDQKPLTGEFSNTWTSIASKPAALSREIDIPLETPPQGLGFPLEFHCFLYLIGKAHVFLMAQREGVFAGLSRTIFKRDDNLPLRVTHNHHPEL